jgi:response regulator NasT
MDSVLIVSHTEKSVESLKEMLSEGAIPTSPAAHTCSQARRLLIDQDFDLCIINAPRMSSATLLPSMSLRIGDAGDYGCQKAKLVDAVSELVEDWGRVRPGQTAHRVWFWSAL